MSSGAGSRARRLSYGAREGVFIAFQSIRAAAFRSALTILGVAIGVSVVVIMAALITGIRGEVAEGIESAGPRNLYVARFDVTDVQLVQDGTQRPPWFGRPALTVEDAERLREVEGVAEAVVSIGGMGGNVLSMSYRGENVSGVQADAEDASWPEYRSVEFVAGRNFHRWEVDRASPVMVISERLGESLFGEGDPVGRQVRVGFRRVPVEVVGVFDPGESLFMELSPHQAVVPHTTAVRRLGMSDRFLEIIVVPEDGWEVAQVEDRVVGAMRGIRGLGPADDNDFSILRSEQLMDFFDQVTGVFFLVMLALSSVGLLVGGVGVVGIMMISVTERTREIGIRKAVGATRGEILWQFLVEAAVLTVLGGGLGLLAGAGVAGSVAALTPVPATIPLWSVAAALGVAALTGLLFGLLPAYRAARMEPVRALRYE